MNVRASLVTLLISAAACSPLRRSAPPIRYSLLNPVLSTDPEHVASGLRPFAHKVRRLIEEKRKAGLVLDVSLHYRDMENGPTFEVDSESKYTPASLLKVPLMMATLKEAEKDPSLLSRRVKNNLPEPARTDFDVHALKRDAEYTVDELLQAMIGASDNDAVVMLRSLVGDEPLNAVFRDFGLLIPEVRSLDDSMTAREYSGFFRILYNASYLNEEMSQKALDYLAASRFRQALVAGVPPGVTVAHKFGERSFADRASKQLHDCGIVYHPVSPYALCVMTRGEKFGDLSRVIRDISALVYQEVDARKARTRTPP